MSTFFELQTQIADAKFRKTVLLHLVEYLDANFRSVGGSVPKNVLLTDEKSQIPPHIFESTVADLLLAEASLLDEEIMSINNASLVAAPPAAAPPPSAPPSQDTAQAPFIPGVQQPFVPPPPPVLPVEETQVTPVSRKRRQAPG